MDIQRLELEFNKAEEFKWIINDDNDDLIDEDTLLDSEDLNKPYVKGNFLDNNIFIN